MPLIQPSTTVKSTDLWLGDFVNNDLRPRYFKHLDDGKDHLHFFFGFEQSFNCRELNCALHDTWHFHFMEVLETDIETVQSEYFHLESQISSWVNQLTKNRFPSITFDYSSLIGDQQPSIISHRYF